MIRDGIIGLIMFYKGEDVLAKTHEQFVEELMEINSEIEVIGRYTKAVDRIRVKCLNCGKEWEPLAYSLLQGRSCSHCSAVRGAKTHSGKTAAKTKEAFESQLKIVDNVPEDDAKVTEAIATLASQGCKLIIGISFGYINAMNDAAKKPEYQDIIKLF